MWNPLILLLLIGTALGEYEHGWKKGKEYHYLIRSRTLTALDKLDDQYTGIIVKALLTVQRQNDGHLRAKISNAQYAQIHTELPDGWESSIPDQNLELRDMPISEKPFEIKMKHGVVRDLIVDKSVPTWELNVLKSIVSQLQVDTQGENAKWRKTSQVPQDDKPYALFKAMEDTVSGKCEVLYDLAPLPEQVIQAEPELVPLPQLKANGQYIEIIKTKNYEKCDQRMGYHYGITGQTKWEPGANDNGDFLSKSSTSRIVISGNLKSFTIQSSVTTNKMFVSPKLNDHQSGMVVSRMNLTLARVNDISSPLASPEDPESTGNLVYAYSEDGSLDGQRRGGRPSVSEDSRDEADSKKVNSASGSEESRYTWDDSSASTSGSSEFDSSMRNIDEAQYLQAKPKLEEAPANPMLPYFVGYKGKPIRSSDMVDVVEETKKLLQQIADELQNPDEMPSTLTLEKFTILSSLIRTMSRKQIVQTEEHLPYADSNVNDEDYGKKQAAFTAFRDAIAEAGTGPALLTIKDWIEKGKIHGLGAADILAHLPANVRTPTAEYVHELFKLVKSPQVMKQSFLNASAILAFGNIVRESQIDKRSLHNRYPVHSFGRMSPKKVEAVFSEYIPYLGEQLKKSVKAADGPRIQMYAMALGNIGHPRILSQLEPYMEGREKVTTFQRLVMVTALGKLADQFPEVARSVLFKVYLNTEEAPEIRSMAVILLMKAKPSFGMLQRLAEYTRLDKSKHVNSVVKSAIESAALLSGREFRKLSHNARIARNLLSKRSYSYGYSRSIMVDSADPEKNLAYSLVLSYVGGGDSIVPRILYVSLDKAVGGYQIPTLKLGAMISSVRQLLQRHSFGGNKLKNSITENIAKMLNIQAEDVQQFEGNIFADLHTVAFDSRHISEIPQLISALGNRLREGFDWDKHKFCSWEMTLAFPTETGLPFIYTYKGPLVFKSHGRIKGSGNIQQEMSAQTKIHFLFAGNIQGRVGFITPFDYQHFMAGVDVNVQVQFPGEAELKVDLRAKRLELKLRPQSNDKTRFLHYSVVPFTAKHDILSFKPVRLEHSTQEVHTKDPKKFSVSYPGNAEDGRFFVHMDSDRHTMDSLFSSSSSNPLTKYIFPASQDDGSYIRLDVFVKPEMSKDEAIVLSAVFDSMVSHSDSSSELLTQHPLVSDEEPDSPVRRKQMLENAAKGIRAAKAYVLDLGLEVPGDLRNRHALTIALAHSNVDEKSQAVLYWHVNLPERDVAFEVCAVGQARFPEIPTLDYERTLASDPSSAATVFVAYGRKCSGGGKVTIDGKLTRSKEMLDYVKNLPSVKQCLEEMKEGNKALQACQRASAAASTVDQLDATVKFDDDSKILKILTDRVIDTIKNMAYPNVFVNPFNPRNNDRDTIELNVKMSPDFQKTSLGIYTNEMDLRFPEENLVRKAVGKTSGLTLNEKTDPWKDYYDKSCVLDNNKAKTFDDKVYSLKLGQCQHVVFTTYPKKSSDGRQQSLHIPQDMQVSVLARETPDGDKEVQVNLGDQQVNLSPASPRPMVTVDGKRVEYSQTRSYLQKRKEDGAVVFKVYELPGGVTKLHSEQHDVKIIYDGQRVQIKASDKYRNSVRGLCGNYDDQPDNDFTTPKNCMLKKPEEFTATYALTQRDCSGPALENAKKAQQSVCRKETIRPSDVISDREAGRTSDEQARTWGYHPHGSQDRNRCDAHRTGIVENSQEICFSVRPVPGCAKGCNPLDRKTKNYELHCMRRNKSSEEMKKRVQQGANPDFSQKPVTRTGEIEIPVNCRPAAG